MELSDTEGGRRATDVTPLDGIRVVEFATLIAGPSATAILATLGADVIKVEPLAGDASRGLVPSSAPTKIAPAFLANNVDKRSIALDLKAPDGASIARRLIESADIVVDNYRRGVFARLGLEPEELIAANERLIWITISGYGPRGSWADRPAVDQIIQAASGMMATTGSPDSVGFKTGYPAVDHSSAHVVVELALALLLKRGRCGQGGRFVVSLYDVALSLQTTPITDYLVSGQVPERLGNAGPLSAPADSVRALDGEVMLVAYQEPHWRALCECLGLTHLLDDSRFEGRLERLKNRIELIDEIERATSRLTSVEVAESLEAVGLMAAPIESYPAVVSSEQTVANELLVSVTDGHHEDYRTVRQPADVFADPTRERRVPLLGEDTVALLQELGYSGVDIHRLSTENVVAAPPRTPSAGE